MRRFLLARALAMKQRKLISLGLALAGGVCAGLAYDRTPLGPLIFVAWFLAAMALAAAAGLARRWSFAAGALLCFPWLFTLTGFAPEDIAIALRLAMGAGGALLAGAISLASRPLFRRPTLATALVLATTAGVLEQLLPSSPVSVAY